MLFNRNRKVGDKNNATSKTSAGQTRAALFFKVSTFCSLT